MQMFFEVKTTLHAAPCAFSERKCVSVEDDWIWRSYVDSEEAVSWLEIMESIPVCKNSIPVCKKFVVDHIVLNSGSKLFFWENHFFQPQFFMNMLERLDT